MGSGVIVEARGSFSRAPTGTSVCFPGAPGTPSSQGHHNRGSQGRRRRLQAPAAGARSPDAAGGRPPSCQSAPRLPAQPHTHAGWGQLQLRAEARQDQGGPSSVPLGLKS